jgi:arylsulfatase A-like enzyme
VSTGETPNGGPRPGPGGFAAGALTGAALALWSQRQPGGSAAAAALLGFLYPPLYGLWASMWVRLERRLSPGRQRLVRLLAAALVALGAVATGPADIGGLLLAAGAAPLAAALLPPPPGRRWAALGLVVAWALALAPWPRGQGPGGAAVSATGPGTSEVGATVGEATAATEGSGLRTSAGLERPWAALARPPQLAGSDEPCAVMISVDTLRADSFDRALETRAGGALARFVAEGRRYTQARSVAPWTVASVAGLLTGRAPHLHGAGYRADDGSSFSGVRPDVPTLAERLRAGGFVTAALVANPYLSEAYGFGRGFDYYRRQDSLARFAGFARGRLLLRPLERQLESRYSADGSSMAALASEYLAPLGPGRFFLWVHLMDPHEPYRGGGEDRVERWSCAPEEVDCFARTAGARSGTLRVDAEESARIRGLYEGDVDRTLASLDALLADVDAATGGRCLVALLSDHGEEFWEHGALGHGQSLYDELLRVPLVVRAPGAAPAVVTQPVALDQVAATVLAHAGLTPEPGMAPALPAGDAADRPLAFGATLFGLPQSAVLIDQLKLIAGPGERRAAYDLLDDPGELADISAAAGELRAWDEALPPAVPEQLGEAGLDDALRSLGYLE